MKRMIAIAAAVLCALAALSPSRAVAQISDSWQFRGILYLYLPLLDGKTTFPGAGSDVSVDPSQIIDHLEFGFLATLEVQKGHWGAFTDFIYLNVGGSNSQTQDFTVGGAQLPAGATASATFDMKSVVWTTAGTYQVVADPHATLSVLAGARLLDVDQTLDWQLSGNIGSIPLPGRAGTRAASAALWDGIIGVKGQFAFGAQRKWFTPYYLDVGTGESDLTWQAMGGIGYSLFHWGDVIAAWRYLYYNMESGEPIESLSFNGPLLAFAFHW